MYVFEVFHVAFRFASALSVRFVRQVLCLDKFVSGIIKFVKFIFKHISSQNIISHFASHYSYVLSQFYYFSKLPIDPQSPKRIGRGVGKNCDSTLTNTV